MKKRWFHKQRQAPKLNKPTLGQFYIGKLPVIIDVVGVKTSGWVNLSMKIGNPEVMSIEFGMFEKELPTLIKELQ